MRTSVTTIAAVLMFGTAALADTYVVAPDGSGDYPTIQAAIDAAMTADVIELVDGVFTGEGNRDLDFGGKAITVRSASDDPDSCVIDCQGSFADPHRGFVFQSGESSASVLRGIGIVHGSTLETCPGCHGGGIYCTNGSSPTLEYCTLRENVAATAGGGLYIDGGCSPTITACRFIDNAAVSSTASAGGLACGSGFTGTVTDCVFSGNTASRGGGLSCYENSPTFLRCLFTRNRTTSEGGGAACQLASPTFVECVFSQNSCDFFGGGLFFVLCDGPVVRNCTIQGNSGRFGAGIDSWDSTVGIENTIVAFNDEGEAIFCEGAGVASLSCCDLYGNEDGDWVGCIADQASINGNQSSDPLFCDPTVGDLSLDENSGCLPDNNECGILIGALGQGCGPVSVPGDSDSPRLVALGLSVHPNPFNPLVTISFELTRSDRVEIAVYTLSGRWVTTLVDRTFAAGSHNLTWNGRDDTGREVPSGIYLSRLEVGEQAMHVRMTLVR